MVSNHADYNNADYNNVDYNNDNVKRPSAKDIMLATISSQIGTIENRGRDRGRDQGTRLMSSNWIC